ncbi:MAG TPA: glucosamine-6-phosphate deaminase, partial [bacterium]|nr:glucosamine-6-phosphate deaminase [bacterium]
IILLVNGAKKAEILARAIEGPVTSLISASALQFHQRVSVFLDEPAASALKRVAYYRFSEEAEKKIGREIF